MNLVQYTPEQLLAMDNSKPIVQPITPLERYNLLKRRFIGTPKRFRKFHFIAIMNCTKIHVFNGVDELVIIVDNNSRGIIEARKCCLELFTTITESQKAFLDLEKSKRDYSPHDYFKLRKELLARIEFDNKNGGYTFSLFNGNVSIDLSLGYSE